MCACDCRQDISETYKCVSRLSVNLIAAKQPYDTMPYVRDLNALKLTNFPHNMKEKLTSSLWDVTLSWLYRLAQMCGRK